MDCIVVSIGCVAVGFRMIQIAMKKNEIINHLAKIFYPQNV